MTKQSLFQVVIVGRTNVGKSTLFNRLSNNVTSIVLDQEGVTRDFVRDTISWQGRTFDLIDTGGFSMRLGKDPIQQMVIARATDMIHKANLVLFVCDGTIGVVQEDRSLASFLHAQKVPVVLVINKIDVINAQEQLHEFYQLGFETIVTLSASHGTGTVDLLDAMMLNMVERSIVVEEQKPLCRVAIVGKPNVGKSSLLNTLLKQDRAIVTDVAGTTREAISECIQFYKESFEITDTPGVRKKASINEPLEEMMVKSTMSALKDADIVLYVVDGSAGTVSDQELKLLFYAFVDQHKAVILLFNKQDIVTTENQETLKIASDEYEFFFKKLMTLSISCKTGKNIGKVLPLVEQVWKRYSQRMSDHELTILFKEALARKPLFSKQQELRLYSVQQVKTAPVTIVLMVNQAHLYGVTQLAFFEGILRKNYDLRGVPIRLFARTKSS